MRVFLSVVILALVLVAITGYSLGWFTVTKTATDEDTTWSLTVNKNRWHKDRDEYRQQAEAKLKDMDNKIDELQAKAMHVETESRAGLVRTIDDLRRQEQGVRDELAKSGNATEEHWQSTKTRLAQALNDLEQGFQKAWSRFKDK